MLEIAPMTRPRLYLLIDSFERDMTEILSRYVLSVLDPIEALQGLYDKCLRRREEELGAPDDVALAHYLDLRESYDLLNVHRALLPVELAQEVRELTPSMDRLVAIRKRIMHPRPLHAGDSEASQMILRQFRSRFWLELHRALQHLDDDPTWEPVQPELTAADRLLHNLPLADYDETGLIGRQREVEEVVGLIRRGREPVITITGEGGIGKTALALEVAYQIVDDETVPLDAVLWTSLKYERLTSSGVREITNASRNLMAAVKPLGQTLDETFEGNLNDLSEALSGLKVLIVFDNLETVGGGEFAELYNALPDSVTYLVTSRVGVGEFERRYPLDPLSDRDSVQMFNDLVRARRQDRLLRLSSSARAALVKDLRNSPVAIKWFVLAVEAGRDPVSLMKNQEELLEFCVRSVYDSLSEGARQILAALTVLARSTTTHEIVILLDEPNDVVNLAIQELVRGALVRRETVSSGSEMVSKVSLTTTATQFLRTRERIDSDLSSRILERERQLKADEERRLVDAASRSLDPVVVRTRNAHDGPTASLLRQALLDSRRDDFDAAMKSLETARTLSPDFWEVYRVEGFLRARLGENAAATQAYETAYGLCEGIERGVVCHFYSGHIARNLRNPSGALPYAREAHQLLQSDETAIQLGNYLVWCNDFEAAIPLIQAATTKSGGKVRLIAITALAEAYRRQGEYARDQERNPLKQFRLCVNAFEVASASLDSGVADDRLRGVAADAAASAIRAARDSLQDGHSIPELPDFLRQVGRSLVRLERSSRMQALTRAIEALAVSSGAPSTAARLRDQVRLIASFDEIPEGTEPSGTLIGEVVALKESYGFVRHPMYPNNLFFHRGDMVDVDSFGELSEGSLVSFVMTSTDRGPRAQGVAREHI